MRLRLSIALLSLIIFALSGAALAQAGAVYTLTNSSSGNAVLIFNRAANGQMSAGTMVSTGGMGSGGGLGNQGALAIDADNNFLFAVNAGSDNISVFKIRQNNLHLVSVTPSGGSHPISLTVNHGLLYVLNNGGAVGGTDTIAGFAVSPMGKLSMIVSGLGLSAASVGPAQIGFNNAGNVLLVTEKTTNSLDVFTVNSAGVASGPTVVASVGQTPFGFAFGKRDQAIVSEAFGGGANAGAMSSYLVSQLGTVQTISGTVADNQSAPCWVVITNDGRFAYTTNTASGNISAYGVNFAGKLRLLNATASTGTGSKPLDAAISNDGRYLYALTPGTGNIQGFFVALDGSLSPLTQASGVPASASGLIVR
jgi:6-phosphogluconolactonase